jgi:hypothetical protein
MRKAALLSLLAMSSALMPAAFAQGWDDAAEVRRVQEMQAATEQQPGYVSPQDAYNSAMKQAQIKQDATIEAIRRQTGQANSPLEMIQRRLGPEGTMGEGYTEDGSVKFRMVQGPDGNLHVEQDTRGEAPMYADGFGKFNPNQQQEQDPRQMTTLTPEMVRALQQRSGKMGPPGNPMFDKASGSGFFGGMTAPKEAVSIDRSEFNTRHDDGQPAWAKDKLNKVHHYVDGQEHHGAEDPHGFF